MSFLFDELTQDGPTELDLLSDTQPQGEHDIDRWNEMQNLASVWNPIPHEVQLLLKPYLEEILSDANHDPDFDRTDEGSPA